MEEVPVALGKWGVQALSWGGGGCRCGCDPLSSPLPLGRAPGSRGRLSGRELGGDMQEAQRVFWVGPGMLGRGVKLLGGVTEQVRRGASVWGAGGAVGGACEVGRMGASNLRVYNHLSFKWVLKNERTLLSTAWDCK